MVMGKPHHNRTANGFLPGQAVEVCGSGDLLRWRVCAQIVVFALAASPLLAPEEVPVLLPRRSPLSAVSVLAWNRRSSLVSSDTTRFLRV